MHRRSFLGLLGSAATAGCVGTYGATPAPTTTGPDARVVTADGYSIGLGPMAVQASILVVGIHSDVRAHRGAGFLQVPVELSEPDGGPVTDRAAYDRLAEGLSVVLDGNGHDGVAVDHAGAGPGVLHAVAVTANDYESGEVRLDLGDGGSIRVPVVDQLLAALADPPAFAVRDLTVDGPLAGETLSATISLENVGGTAGRFLAELGPQRVSDAPAVRFDVAAGEAMDRDVSVPYALPAGAETATIRLEWGVGQLERTVAVAVA